MRIAVDVTPLHDPRSGIGTWCREVLSRLAAGDDELVAYSLSWRGRGDAVDLPAGVRRARGPMAAGPLLRAWAAGDRPRIERWTGPVDAVLGTNFVAPPTAGAAVAVVYDLGPWQHPDLVVPAALRFPRLVARAVARGAHVLTISATVAAELGPLLGLPPARVHWAHLAPAPGPAGDPAAGAAAAGSARYVLALGTEDPRKGLDVLVAAFARLAGDHPGVRLVLAGQEGQASAAVDAAAGAGPGLGDRVARLGWVDEQARADLLAGAAILAYPSRHEGFGLPPVEAMAAGVPVVASDAGALPEVLGDAAVLVPAGDVDALAAALAAVLDGDPAATGLAARGRARAAGYSWDETAVGVRRALAAAAGG